MKVPFNKPFIVGRELYNIAQAVIENSQLSGGGEFTQICQDWLVENLGCHHALLTHSCTAALEMSAILADIQQGDEVIMPSFTFVSTANAFVLRGATPVFVDIRPDTLNIDETLIEQAITPKTKAIVPVHYAGIPCAMNEILQIGTENDILVIEDAAQALLSDYQGKKLGTIGQLGTLSFHETKNIISGEGGALLINDESMVERAEIIWEKGTNRKSFYRGEVDKYSWVDIGSSFLPGEIVAAFLAAQFDQAEIIIADRKRIFEHYCTLLNTLEEEEFIKLPNVGEQDNNNGHIFFIVLNSPSERDHLIKYLHDNGVNSIFHYVPLHSSPAGLKYGRIGTDLPNTELAGSCVLRLPLYHKMKKSEITYVAELISNFFLNP